ncbi:MAG: UDP-N-acetylglucosamine 2-epimerase [Desulfovermiculus sp.]|nr:UDP-N-acetylglucosamine 2-epimerase [Desulfovermiculus sp.]
MKVAPLYHVLAKTKDLQPVLIHTGQHYDLNMSDVFFQHLKLPEPDIHLGVGGEKIVRVGNIVIDSLEMLRENIESQQTTQAFGVQPGEFGIVTLHRPSNVDHRETLTWSLTAGWPSLIPGVSRKRRRTCPFPV